MISDIVVAILVLLGSLLALTAAIGVLRFPDTLTRMHATTKPQTFGLLLILIAAMIRLAGSVDFGMLVLSGLFALITAPVVAHRIGRLAYLEQRDQATTDTSTPSSTTDTDDSGGSVAGSRDRGSTT